MEVPGEGVRANRTSRDYSGGFEMVDHQARDSGFVLSRMYSPVWDDRDTFCHLDLGHLLHFYQARRNAFVCWIDQEIGIAILILILTYW